jgi:MarR family transcriptional regulator, organic hydroperoxide resistance regulator
MNKHAAINEIKGIQKRLSHALPNYGIENWRKLEVPLAQLKSLFMIANTGCTNC